MQPACAALTRDYRLDHGIVARRVGACRKRTSCPPQGHEILAGHVENGVWRGLLFYEPDGLTGRYDDQFDVAAFRLKWFQSTLPYGERQHYCRSCSRV